MHRGWQVSFFFIMKLLEKLFYKVLKHSEYNAIQMHIMNIWSNLQNGKQTIFALTYKQNNVQTWKFFDTWYITDTYYKI